MRKKEELLERLESGVERLDLHEEEFSVHEAASALKALLAGLDEPLLTDLCFPAVTSLGRRDRNYWLSGLRLLLQVNQLLGALLSPPQFSKICWFKHFFVNCC